MMVELGKTEVFKRQIAQPLQRLSDSDFAPLHAFEKFFQFFGVHGLIENRVGHDGQAGILALLLAQAYRFLKWSWPAALTAIVAPLASTTWTPLLTGVHKPIREIATPANRLSFSMRFLRRWGAQKSNS
jgi:hypothetical protein